MKVRIVEDSSQEDGVITIIVKKADDNIRSLLGKIETKLMCRDGNEDVLVPAESIILARTENGETAVHTKTNKRYIFPSPLYAAADCLGDDFIRISKWALVRLSEVERISTAYNGRAVIHLSNGMCDTLSRSCRKDFRRRIYEKNN